MTHRKTRRQAAQFLSVALLFGALAADLLLAPTVAAQEESSKPPAEEPSKPPALKSGDAITWTKIPLPGSPKSPQGSMKHQRLVEGPKGRIYILGGDWGGGTNENTGRQEVYSFDPLVADGDWRMDAPYIYPKETPQRIVHFHTDEAGVAFDEKRKVIWKLAGTIYGGKGETYEAEGRSVRAKVIQFDPEKCEWQVPQDFDQKKNFGYCANGVLDPDKDELVQITNTDAWHLSLASGKWTSHSLGDGPVRFNAIAARVGRDLFWSNRKQVLESYNLDTHKLTTHSAVPWPVPTGGWEMQMVMPYGGKVLVVRPTSLAGTPRHAAIYDPATRQWTPLDPGEGRGNTGMMHSSGRVVLMGGMAPPEDHNKFVWVGQIEPLPLQRERP